MRQFLHLVDSHFDAIQRLTSMPAKMFDKDLNEEEGSESLKVSFYTSLIG